MTSEATFLGSIDETVVKRFESAWRGGARPAVEEFIPAAGPLFLTTLEELVHIDLEFRWKSAKNGERPPTVEDYVKRFPALGDSAIVRRLARQEFELRQRHGDRPDRTEYLKRFPDAGLDTAALNSAAEPTANRTAAPGLAPGDQLGRYRLSVEHARGGFGLVWRAADDALGREVALKQLSVDLASDEETRRRFLAEARVAARLQHPGVVPVYDVAAADCPHPYYTMKLVRGQTLTEAIRRFHETRDESGRAVEQLRLLNSFLAVVRTVAFAHDRGVIHRDLKPDNIILGDYGESVLLDWGLAKVKQDADGSVLKQIASTNLDLTQRGSLVGTPAYMAPEQADGITDLVDERSDVHALGIILYQLLTGSRPFPGATLPEVLQQVREHAPVGPRAIRPAIGKPLEAICLKAMAKGREERYPTAAELARDLERFLADEPVTAYHEGPRERLGRWSRRHRTVVATGTVASVVAVVALTAGFFLWRDADRRRRQQDEARIADVRRSALSGEEYALAELRQGHYANAETLLAQAVRTTEGEPRLEELTTRLRGRLARARGIVQFYRSFERGEVNGFHEYDRQALGHIELALGSLNALDVPNWLAALPAEELTDEQAKDSEHQLRQLREDVYRAIMLRAALNLKLIFMRNPRDAEVQAGYRRVLDIMQSTELLRPSFSGNLIKLYCFNQLGERHKIAGIKRVLPSEPADFYFSGMAHFWIGQFPDNPITDEAKKPLVQLVLRGLGFDFARPTDVAKEHLRAATDRDPTHFWSRLWLAWALEWSGEIARAAEAYEVCVALRPNDYLGYTHRGRTLAQLAAEEKDPAKRRVLERRAFADLARAAELQPHEPDSRWPRYRSLVQLGRTDEAFPELGRIVDRQRPLQEFQFQALQRELIKLFIEVHDTAAARTQASPRDVEAWSILAGAAQLLAQSDSAITAADRALQIQPDHVRALTVRGQARAAKNRPAEALSDFNAALSGDARHPPAGLGRAKALEAVGRYAEALAAFDTMLTEYSMSDWYRGEAHLGRARSLAQLKRADEARQAIEEARQLHPDGAIRVAKELFP